MTKEQTRELLDDYINFHEKNGVTRLVIEAMRRSASEYVEGVIDSSLEIKTCSKCGMPENPVLGANCKRTDCKDYK